MILREVSYNDFDGIRILMKRYGLIPKDYEAWEHLWKNNPVILSSNEPWPIGWAIENSNKQVVGYIGNIPVAYEFKGRGLIAAVATSWVVDSPYRGHSISLLRKCFFAQKYPNLFLDTTADYKAGKVFSALGAHRVPVDSYDICFFWIINYKKFLKSAFFKKNLSANPILIYPLSLIIKSIDSIIRRNRYINKPCREIKYYTVFDERFDIFWDNLKRRYNNRLLCVRDSKFLNWHFKYEIMHKKIWIFVAEDKGSMIGYAVFLRQDNPDIGLKRVKLVDIQVLDESSDILMKMVSAGIRRCQKEDIYVLEAIGFNLEKRSIMERYSPYRRKLPAWPFFYRTKDTLMEKALADPKVWDPCLLDGDASL